MCNCVSGSVHYQGRAINLTVKRNSGECRFVSIGSRRCYIYIQILYMHRPVHPLSQRLPFILHLLLPALAHWSMVYSTYTYTPTYPAPALVTVTVIVTSLCSLINPPNLPPNQPALVFVFAPVCVCMFVCRIYRSVQISSDQGNCYLILG